jgi:hypothetical protein
VQVGGAQHSAGGRGPDTVQVASGEEGAGPAVSVLPLLPVARQRAGTPQMVPNGMGSRSMAAASHASICTWLASGSWIVRGRLERGSGADQGLQGSCSYLVPALQVLALSVECKASVLLSDETYCKAFQVRA